jgi:WD40 repeat protein
VESVDISHDNRFIAAGSSDGNITFYKINDVNFLKTIKGH